MSAVGKILRKQAAFSAEKTEMPEYVKRHAEEKFQLLNGVMRVVCVSGPRQCGKTTLMRHEFNGKAEFVSLDISDNVSQAQAAKFWRA